ncbi:Hha toxicity modulator TomB [Tatumella saanichensis]|uniref:Hha toxicity modulator TomB n=1 Tax=Tatumella saanichensis TaxID=480813 RepID=UPI0004A46339|nr:Hha toxicity modulator TomB [Tatumella saanichensis]
MDEYSPKRYDVAQLRFLCESLSQEIYASINTQQFCWINDPTSPESLQINDLIEHIADVTIVYKLKHPEDEVLISQVDTFLDDTFTLLSRYTVNKKDFLYWEMSSKQLVKIFFDASAGQRASHQAFISQE